MRPAPTPGHARPPTPGRYNPIKTIKTSFLGTMNMLGLAKRTRARFLLTSTSEASRGGGLGRGLGVGWVG